MTGLEPATSGVTGQHSNRLSYIPLEGYTLQLPMILTSFCEVRFTKSLAEETFSQWSPK